MEASRQRRLELVFLLTVAAFLVGFCLLGLFHYRYSDTLMRFPLLAAGATLVVVVVHLLGLRKAAPPELAPASDSADLEGRHAGAAWGRLLWLFAIVPLVFVFGFPAGLALYLICFLKSVGEGWRLSLAVAGASLLLSYGLFIRVLGVSLPQLPVWWPA